MLSTRERALRGLAVCGTALLLMGHGLGDPAEFLHPNDACDGTLGFDKFSSWSQSFGARGDCGADGSITLVARQGACGVRIAGDDIGVPLEGDRWGPDMFIGDFRLDRQAQNAQQRCEAAADAEADLLLSCSRPSCEVRLYRERAPDCAAFECPALDCDSDQKAVLPPGACCQVCEALPAEPVCDSAACPELDCEAPEEEQLDPGACCARCVAPRVCNPELCWPEDCAADELPEQAEGACCPSCLPIDEQCQQGRETFLELRPAALSDFQSCAADADCLAVSSVTACGGECPLPLNEASVPAAMGVLSRLGDELCSSCGWQMPKCPAPPELGCVNGTCTVL